MPGVYGDIRPADDNETPHNGVSSRPDPESRKPAQQADPFTGKGALLEEQDDAAVFEAIHAIVKRQEPLAKNRDAKDKHWSRVRRGIPFSTLTKDEDRSTWKADLPPGIDDRSQPIPNKADDLCRKIGSTVMADPPIADPKPATDSDRDRGSAEIAKKFLKADGEESGTNDNDAFRACVDLNVTKASAFVHVWVDQTGGGWRPRQIKAHPLAQDASNPLVAYEPVTDPATGQPMLDAMGQPQQREVPTSDYELRYVTSGQQFTDDPAQADRQWLPKHQRDILTHANVRTVPETADVHRAEAVILVMSAPLSEAKRRFPALADLDEDTLASLCEWRPLRPKSVVASAFRNRLTQQDREKGKGSSADTLIFWYQKYCRVNPDYPDGADIAVNGASGGYVFHKALLRDDVATDEGTVPVLRDIPVAQFKCLHDSEEGDPMGRPAIELFAGANEALAHLYGALLEHMDAALHPDVFIAALSPVQPWQLRQRTNKPINVTSKEDMPVYEDVNDLPSFLPAVLDRLNTDAQMAAQLGDTAAGLDVATSSSGVAKQTVVQQAKVHLAAMAQNFFTGVKRYWRIKLQLAQAKLTVPQQMEFVGTDSAYKLKWFTGSDFAGVKDVAIMPGSGTMMAPAEKQQHVSVAASMGAMDPDEVAEVSRSLMGDDLGLTPSPHRELIGRQIAQWSEGPPEGFQPAQPQHDPMGQPVIGPDGQQAMTPASPTPFTPRPTDEDPSVARIRYRKLRDFIATGEYSKQPPEWRALMDTEYQRMAYAAGVQTMRQQAEAAAQQQQTQQNADAAKGAREDANNDKDREAATERTALQTQARLVA